MNLAAATRLGPTPARMDRALRRLLATTAPYGARPTLPITATVLSRHPAVIRHYADQGVDVAVHGMVHGDHRRLSYAEQLQSLLQADALFRRAGIAYSGFRGPYSRFNGDTERALRRLHYRYHSSQAVAFTALPDLDGAAAWEAQVLTFVGAQHAASVAVRPRDADGLIHLPVALPDDEIMVDRLRLDERTRAQVWLSILEQTYRRGELFVLQLHPERIVSSEAPLHQVLDRAQKKLPGVWLATLDEIARWWIRRGGLRIELAAIDAGRWRVELNADQGARLVGRNVPEVATTEWFGRDRLIVPSRFELTSPRKPVVGVSLRTPLPVRAFLREEGFLVEASDEPERVGAYVDIDERGWTEQELLATVDRAEGPLIRLWRWPNAARSALAVSGDIDAITLQDYLLRYVKERPRQQQRLDPVGLAVGLP